MIEQALLVHNRFYAIYPLHTSHNLRNCGTLDRLGQDPAASPFSDTATHPVGASDTEILIPLASVDALDSLAPEHLPPQQPTNGDPSLSVIHQEMLGASLACESLFPGNDLRRARISRISPQKGSLLGGDQIVVFGDNFAYSDVCLFGGMPAHIVNVECEGRLMLVRSPPGREPGEVSVNVHRAADWAKHSSLIAREGGPCFRYADNARDEIRDLALRLVGRFMDPPLFDIDSIIRKIINCVPSLAQYAADDSLEHILLRVVARFETGGTAERGVALSRAAAHLRGRGGRVLLHLASALGYHQLLTRIISTSDPSAAVDSNGLNPLQFARLYHHTRCEALLLSRLDEIASHSGGLCEA